MLIIKNVCRPRHAIQVIYRTPVINQNPQQMSDRDTKSFQEIHVGRCQSSDSGTLDHLMIVTENLSATLSL